MIGCDCDVCRSTDPRDARSRPSIAIECDDGLKVLVDTTPDLRSQALRHDLRRVDAVLFTHSHADHVMGLDEVRRYNMLTKQPMPVYGDTPTLRDIRRTFAYIFESDAPKGGGIPDLRLFPIAGSFCLGRQLVQPVPIRHGSWNILGFRFGGFAYLTDCNGIPDASMEMLRDLDCLVLDALRKRPHPTHFTITEATEMAGRIGARRTYFTHIAHELGHEATCASLPPGMALAYDGLSVQVA
jgi:phosphoribosyl 1,2-cyclic phosphate phosphodiesterase